MHANRHISEPLFLLCLSRCSIKQSHKKESKSFKVKTGFIIAIAITSTSLQVQQFSASINAEFLFQRSILFFVTTEQMCKEWDNSLAAPEETFNTGEYIFNRHSKMSHKLPPGLWELTGLGRVNYSTKRNLLKLSEEGRGSLMSCNENTAKDWKGRKETVDGRRYQNRKGIKMMKEYKRHIREDGRGSY